jgi:hypothetical protein
MSWYWWIVLGILGLNAFVVILIGLFLIWDRYRSRKAQAADEKAMSKRETRGSGR